MEPNTACSSTAKASSEIVKQGPSSSIKVQSLLSPPSFFSPSSHGLVSALGSRSGSSAMGDGSLSVHGHTTSHSVPSSFLPPTLGTVHMTGNDTFKLQASVATLSLTPLDGQLWQGLAQPPSWTTLDLPACPSASGFSRFAGQVAALEKTASLPQSKMPFFLPTTGFGLPLRSNNDNCIGFTELSSKYKLALPSTSNMLSAFGETMPWHYGDLSMEVGSSISFMPNLSIGATKVKEPMLPPTPPLSQGAGASTNFIGFAQPSSNSKPAEFWASLQVPLPVKQEPINAAATCHDLEFKSLNNEDDEPNQDVIPNWMPENSIVSGKSWSWEAALKHPERSRNNVSGTRIAGRAHCHDQSLSMVISNSSSMPKLSRPLPPSSSVRAGASRRHNHVTGVTFTNAEKEIIRKDKNLQELVNADPKKVKRLVSNRICAAKRKAIKNMHTIELERQVETLQRKCNTKSAELQRSQEKCAELKTEYNEMSMKMQELERQLKLKKAMSETLQAHIDALNLIKLNAVQMGSQKS